MRPKLFFQALLGIVSVGAIIMIIIVYFFGDNNTQVVEKVVEKQVVVYQQAPAAVTPVENHTVVQQPAAPSAVPVQEVAAPAAYTVDDFIYALESVLFDEESIQHSVYLSDNIVVIELSDNENEQIIYDLAVLTLGDVSALASWDYLRNGIKYMSAEARSVAAAMGLDDIHVSVMYENPLNQGAMLLITLDDEIMYDFTEDLDGNT